MYNVVFLSKTNTYSGGGKNESKFCLLSRSVGPEDDVVAVSAAHPCKCCDGKENNLGLAYTNYQVCVYRV